MDKYKFIDDLTSDVMFEAFGAKLEELLVNAAEALFSVVCDINRIVPEQALPITVEAEDEAGLLHSWLSTLLTESEIGGLFLRRFDIIGLKRGTGLLLQAIAYGEAISPEKGATVVKGITYYGFSLEHTGNLYRAQVAMDV